MIVEGIDHVVLRVHDLERAVSFYADVLGCPVERRQDAIGMVQMRAGRSLIDLVDAAGVLGRKGGRAPDAQGHNMDHLCLAIRDFDLEAMRRHLEENGVPPGEIGSRFGAAGEGMSIYLADPEGNRLELRSA